MVETTWHCLKKMWILCTWLPVWRFQVLAVLDLMVGTTWHCLSRKVWILCTCTCMKVSGTVLDLMVGPHGTVWAGRGGFSVPVWRFQFLAVLNLMVGPHGTVWAGRGGFSVSIWRFLLGSALLDLLMGTEVAIMRLPLKKNLKRAQIWHFYLNHLSNRVDCFSSFFSQWV